MKQYTRVYYRKLPKTFKLVTKDKFLGHYDIYVGYISLVDYSYEIKGLSGKLILKGKSNTLSEAKKQIKNDLKALGVSFFDEVRTEVI